MGTWTCSVNSRSEHQWKPAAGGSSEVDSFHTPSIRLLNALCLTREWHGAGLMEGN